MNALSLFTGTGGLDLAAIQNGDEDKIYTEKFPSNIIEISNANQKGKVHPTQKPVALFEYLIKTYTNEGEIVLDNCIGSGTTAIAALKTGRFFIGIEKDEKYHRIANERVAKFLEELRDAN